MFRLKELRTSRGIRQIDFAKEMGIGQSTLSSWENGRYEPDNDTLAKIASYFNVSVGYLLGHEEKPNHKDAPATGATVPAGQISADDAELLQAIHDRPGLRIMFDLTKSATDEDLKKAVAIIEALYGVSDGD